MRYGIWMVVVVALVVSPALAEDSAPDPVADSLKAAKLEQATVVAKAKLSLLGAIDDRVSIVKQAGDLAAVKEMIAQQEALLDNGKLPEAKALAPAVIRYKRSIEQSEAALIRAYTMTVRTYTKAGKLKEAELAQAELDRFKTPPKVDLLKMLDLSKDFRIGQWKTEDGGLAVSSGHLAQVRFPYSPPDEYDYLVEFTKAGSGYGFGMFLTKSGKTLQWAMPGEKCTWDSNLGVSGSSETNPNTTALC